MAVIMKLFIIFITIVIIIIPVLLVIVVVITEQYVFVYDVLLEALLCGDTTICCDSFPSFYASLCEFDPSIGKSKLEEQFEEFVNERFISHKRVETVHREFPDSTPFLNRHFALCVCLRRSSSRNIYLFGACIKNRRDVLVQLRIFIILRLISATMDRDESTSALRPENIFKNRCKNITPANRCRPYLTTPADESNDYINAVFLNSYKKRDAFIVTQMTLPNTVVDFWRLIYDHNSSTIVMLNEIDEKDESCEMYWTLDTCGENYGPFIVETTAEIKSHPSITVRDFTITNTRNDQRYIYTPINSLTQVSKKGGGIRAFRCLERTLVIDLIIKKPQEAPRIVRQFHFHRWSEGDNFPNSKLALVELLDMVEKWQHETGDSLPVTVHCMNGASRSGLYCAISCVLERINAEKEVDVFQAVKQLRLNRSQLVDNYQLVTGINRRDRFTSDSTTQSISYEQSSLNIDGFPTGMMVMIVIGTVIIDSSKAIAICFAIFFVAGVADGNLLVEVSLIDVGPKHRTSRRSQVGAFDLENICDHPGCKVGEQFRFCHEVALEYIQDCYPNYT
uniref:Protein-tyrosine-phosphatase n=1 Tax=Octopus bimaculoides TaxID=37653 RepID=A0A0L8G606_OCTBM